MGLSGLDTRRLLPVWSVLLHAGRRASAALSRLPRLKAAIPVEAFEWSLEQQWALLADCDAVLLPSHPGRDKLARGHSRQVQIIHAGRLALAYALPAYRELAAYCWCGKDLGQGLTWALSHRAEPASRVAAGQAYIDGRFAPVRIAERWVDAIGHVAHAANPTT